MLVNTGFQVLFHSPPGVLFTFPSQYCSTIGHQVVFRLGGWAPRLPIGFHVSDGTLDTAKPSRPFTYETLTLFRWLFHVIRLDLKVLCRGPNPISISTVVWPLPLSLATTRGISFDFSSSPYLDVSVREVPHNRLWIHLELHLRVGFPIRKSPDRSLFAAPRGLSQLVTSFIGSWCQGIRPVLFFAWTSYYSLVLWIAWVS